MQRFEITAIGIEIGLNGIADPAEQTAAAGADAVLAQAGVIDAAQTQADHQQHRKLQSVHQIGLVQIITQRRQPAAHAFDQHAAAGLDVVLIGDQAAAFGRHRQIAGNIQRAGLHINRKRAASAIAATARWYEAWRGGADGRALALAEIEDAVSP